MEVEGISPWEPLALRDPCIRFADSLGLLLPENHSSDLDLFGPHFGGYVCVMPLSIASLAGVLISAGTYDNVFGARERRFASSGKKDKKTGVTLVSGLGADQGTWRLFLPSPLGVE